MCSWAAASNAWSSCFPASRRSWSRPAPRWWRIRKPLLNAAGWCRRYRSPIRLLGASRELIEWQARTRVTALANVQVLEGCEAVGLLADRGRDAVTGVRLRPHSRRAEVTDPEAEVSADFVVDASGRSSRAPQWLAALGYQQPTLTRINSLLGYASRQYRIPAGFQADWRMLVINAKPPSNPRAGAVVPIEGDRWMVALIGAGRDYPPTDDAGFLEFARACAASCSTRPSRTPSHCRRSTATATPTTSDATSNGCATGRTGSWSSATPAAPSTRSTPRA